VTSLLKSRVAVVTGGAQRIGFAIAGRYSAEGARVVLGDLDSSSYVTGTVLEAAGGRYI